MFIYIYTHTHTQHTYNGGVSMSEPHKQESAVEPRAPLQPR